MFLLCILEIAMWIFFSPYSEFPEYFIRSGLLLLFTLDR